MSQSLLRPLSYRDIFDETFDLYKNHFLLFVGISAIVLLPIYVISGLFGAGKNSIGNSLFGLLIFPARYLITAATTWAVAQSYLGNVPTILNSYRSLKGRFLSFAWMMFVTSILIFGGSILLIIPGLILYLRYAFVSAVFVVEGAQTGDYRGRSSKLAADNYWRIFVVAFVSILVYYVIGSILGLYSTHLLKSALGTPALRMMLSRIILGLSESIVTPIHLIAIVLLYYDLRVRKEGFDIELLAQSLTPKDQPEPQGELISQ